MASCRARILWIYGGLVVLVALLLVPVRRVTVTEQYGSSGIGTRTTRVETETVILPIYLHDRGVNIMERTGAKVTTALRAKRYGAEIGVVFLLGVVSYFLFCVWAGRIKPV